MNFYQLRAYSEAAERDDTEKLVMLMNCMAMAQHASGKDRQQFAHELLGIESKVEFENFDALFGMAQPTEEQDELRTWAKAAFARDDSFLQQ